VRRVLVACVGNSLVGDDAAGCAVHERLAARPLPRGVRLELLGVGGLRLLDELRGEDVLIAADAVQLGAPAGTVHVLAWEELPAAGAAVTSHGVGLRETIEVGRLLFPEAMPGRAFLVGVEGRVFDQVGASLSPEVAAAIEPAAAAVRDLAAAALRAVPAPPVGQGPARREAEEQVVRRGRGRRAAIGEAHEGVARLAWTQQRLAVGVAGRARPPGDRECAGGPLGDPLAPAES